MRRVETMRPRSSSTNKVWSWSSGVSSRTDSRVGRLAGGAPQRRKRSKSRRDRRYVQEDRSQSTTVRASAMRRSENEWSVSQVSAVTRRAPAALSAPTIPS